MSEQHFIEITQTLIRLLQRNAKNVPGTSNTGEYNRWLKKTLEKARTFDKEDKEHYIDYVARSIEATERADASVKKDKKKRHEKDANSDDGESGKKARKQSKKIS